MDNFRALRIFKTNDGTQARFETLDIDDLSQGDVIIESHYSSLNYKDALAVTGKGKIVRKFPLNAGVDISGVVVESESARLKAGDRVLVTGCGLSETHDGGYAEFVRVPNEWVIPVPERYSLFEAMVLGTAGFTVALAIQRLEDNHQAPDMGSMLVTGASGGIGSFSVDMLTAKGFEVVALTGKQDAEDYLKNLGASRVIDRHQLELSDRPLEKAQWGGAIDSVGGGILGWLTRTVKPWGNIVSVGLAAGVQLETTVMPFILRGITLIGITSANCPIELRHRLWQRLGEDLAPSHLAMIATHTVQLNDLIDASSRLLEGQGCGRTVVQIKQ